MAKARWITPEYYTDGKINAVSDQAALLYPALWQEADDGNVCPGDPEIIYGRKFIKRRSWTVETVTTAMAELERAGIVWAFEHRGERWLYIPRLMTRQGTKPAQWRHLGKEHSQVIEQLVDRLKQKSGEKRRKAEKSGESPRVTPKLKLKPKLSPELSPELLADSPSANGFRLGPFLDAWKSEMGGYPTNPGHLGDLLKPLCVGGDPAVVLARWTSFVHGVAKNPQFFGTEAKQFKRFAATPALYDDPDWYLTPAQRAEDAKAFEGIYG